MLATSPTPPSRTILPSDSAKPFASSGGIWEGTSVASGVVTTSSRVPIWRLGMCEARTYQDRGARAVGVHHPLDEVGVAGTATARADREAAGELRLGRGGKRRPLLVVNVHPVDAALRGSATAAHGVAERVEAVAHQPVDAGHTRLDQDLEQIVGYVPGHAVPLCSTSQVWPSRENVPHVTA